MHRSAHRVDADPQLPDHLAIDTDPPGRDQTLTHPAAAHPSRGEQFLQPYAVGVVDIDLRLFWGNRGICPGLPPRTLPARALPWGALSARTLSWGALA